MNETALDDVAAPPESAARHRRTATSVAVLLAVGSLALGVLVGARLESAPATPADNSPAAGFSRDMQEHHAQAVEMSMLVRDRTDDPQIRTLAYDIALGQQQQIGQMFGWLRLWGLPQTGGEPSMAWAHGHVGGGHPTPGAAAAGSGHAMPGMVAAATLKELEGLSGDAAEVWFLRRMIPHHQGGVAMAQAALALDLPTEVRRLAETIVAAQSSEIDALGALLAERTG
ncbi:MAG: DUF305 domain-containing protein [Sporichthyaceae bacterium]